VVKVTIARQAVAVVRRDLGRERRSGEVVWVTIPFGAVGVLLLPLAVGPDSALLARIGAGVFWVVVMLFGVLTAMRRTAAETAEQRDLEALLGIDPVASFAGRASTTAILLVAFEVVVGAVTVVLYDLALNRWSVMLVLVPGVAAGLAMLGTLSASIVASLSVGPALVPFLVAPLSVPLLLAATAALDPLATGKGILGWLLLMVAVDLVLAIAGVLAARPLMETR
jgi:heme exporter protein B